MNIDHLLSATPLTDGPKLAAYGPRTESIVDEINRLKSAEPTPPAKEVGTMMKLVLENMKDHVVIDGSIL